MNGLMVKWIDKTMDEWMYIYILFLETKLSDSEKQRLSEREREKGNEVGVAYKSISILFVLGI